MVKSWSQQVLALVETSSTHLIAFGAASAVVQTPHLVGISCLMLSLSKLRIGCRFYWKRLKSGMWVLRITRRVAAPQQLSLAF